MYHRKKVKRKKEQTRSRKTQLYLTPGPPKVPKVLS